MKNWSTTAWIFQSVAYAAQAEPAKLDAVIACADGINHAIPTQKELQRSFGRLIDEGLISKIGKTYSLTDQSRALMDECSRGRERMHDTLEAIAVKIPSGVGGPLDETLSEEDLERGFRDYKARFKKLLGKKG